MIYDMLWDYAGTVDDVGDAFKMQVTQILNISM
jgi:hypothetical protein